MIRWSSGENPIGLVEAPVLRVVGSDGRQVRDAAVPAQVGRLERPLPERVMQIGGLVHL